MDEYTSKVRVWELTCPGLPQEVGRARRWAREILADTPCADDAALIVTELGSNAVRHTASGNGFGVFRVALVRSPETVALSVTDNGGTSTAPHLASPNDDDPQGRGLALVAAVAHRIQVRGDRLGRTVTAELPLYTPGAVPARSSHFQGHTP